MSPLINSGEFRTSLRNAARPRGGDRLADAFDVISYGVVVVSMIPLTLFHLGHSL